MLRFSLHEPVSFTFFSLGSTLNTFIQRRMLTWLRNKAKCIQFLPQEKKEKIVNATPRRHDEEDKVSYQYDKSNNNFLPDYIFVISATTAACYIRVESIVNVLRRIFFCAGNEVVHTSHTNEDLKEQIDTDDIDTRI